MGDWSPHNRLAYVFGRRTVSRTIPGASAFRARQHAHHVRHANLTASAGPILPAAPRHRHREHREDARRDHSEGGDMKTITRPINIPLPPDEGDWDLCDEDDTGADCD